MKKYGLLLPILICLMFWLCVTKCFGKMIDDKVKELISEQKRIAIENVDTELAKDSIAISKNIIIDEIKERVRRQKVDEARKYEPTDKEITDKLDAKIESLRKSREVTIP